MTYRSFGWQIHSKISADMRTRNGTIAKKLVLAQNLFSALVKLDWMFAVSPGYTGWSCICWDRHGAVKLSADAALKRAYFHILSMALSSSIGRATRQTDRQSDLTDRLTDAQLLRGK
jgi:hypothetical protein